MSYALPSGHKYYILIGLGPKTNKLEGNSSMVFARISIYLGEWISKDGCHQCLCFQGELPLPPASPWGSPRSAAVSNSGSFQITASALGPGVCEIL